MSATIFCNVFYPTTNKFWQAINHFNRKYNGTARLQPINGGSNLPDDDRILKDNSGNNISYRNKEFNELTSLYWIWQNYNLDDVDYVGHCHYRLFFEKLPKTLTDDIYCARPIPMLFRAGGNVVNGTIEDGYKLCHVSYDWDLMESLIPTDDKILFSEWKHQQALNAPCQMFVMKSELFREYMTYSFRLLTRLHHMIYLTGRDGYQYRALAFIGERILSFWVYKMANEGKSVKELKTIKLEDLKPSNATDYRGNYNF